MVLSDSDILHAVQLGWITIDPFEERHVQPASYDVALHHLFRVFNPHCFQAIVPGQTSEELMTRVDVSDEGEFVLQSGSFVLGMTQERVLLNAQLCARIEGKSSLGRLGLVIHSTAGWIDPGFEGRITLEISNDAPLPIVLTPGMLIGQIAFMTLRSRCVRPYGHPERKSKYQGDMEPTESRYDMED
jgi:dCTP deaminase